jgi:hypothetical protein
VFGSDFDGTMVTRRIAQATGPGFKSRLKTGPNGVGFFHILDVLSDSPTRLNPDERSGSDADH